MDHIEATAQRSGSTRCAKAHAGDARDGGASARARPRRCGKPSMRSAASARPSRSASCVAAVKQVEKENDRAAAPRHRRLFREEPDAKVLIKWKEIYDNVERRDRQLRGRRERDRRRGARERLMEPLLVAVVVTALVFDYTNGFHDAANAVATSISTRAVPPNVALAAAAVLNVVGALISTHVAATLAKGIVEPAAVTQPVMLGGLIGAIAWNLLTWWWALPSSSSHCLIGGVAGAVLATQRLGRRPVGGHRREGADPDAARAAGRLHGRHPADGRDPLDLPARAPRPARCAASASRSSSRRRSWRSATARTTRRRRWA